MKHAQRWWWLIFAGGIALRLFNLGSRPLWYDEAGTAWMASLPFDRMVAATAADVHPPLYLALEWLTSRYLGSSTTELRLPSALLSIASLHLAWRLAQRLKLPPVAALAGASLTAVAPFQVAFAQEARMYALVEFLFIGGILAALGRRWLWLGLAVAGLLWTHNYGWLYSASLNAVAGLQVVRAGGWGRKAWPLWVGLALADAGAVASWLPWLPALVGQVQNVSAGYWLQSLTLGSWLYPFYMQWWGFAVPAWFQSHAALLAFGLTGFALVKAIRRRNRAALLLAGLALGTPLLAGVASATWTPVYLFRALIGSSVPTYLLVGWAVTEGVGRFNRIAVALLLAPALALVLRDYYFGYSPKDDAAPYAAHIRAHWRRGDVIYHANENSALAFYPYFGPIWPGAVLPFLERGSAGLSEGTRRAMGMQSTPLDELAWQRAWYVWASAPTTTVAQDAQAQAVLDSHSHTEILVWDDGMVRIGLWLLERREGATR